MSSPARGSGPGSSRLFFREDLVGLAWDIRVVSTAFDGAGEAQLLLRDHEGRAELEGPRLAMAQAAIAALVRTMEKRVGADLWVLAFGEGPADLANRARNPLAVAALSARLGGSSLIERCRALEALATASPEARPFPELPEACWAIGSVALSIAADEVAEAFRILREQRGPEVELWAADASLAVRISMRSERVSFNAHHPVIQEALARRCEVLGIDLG